MLHQLEYSLQPCELGEGFEESLQERDWRGVKNGRKEKRDIERGKKTGNRRRQWSQGYRDETDETQFGFLASAEIQNNC